MLYFFYPSGLYNPVLWFWHWADFCVAFTWKEDGTDFVWYGSPSCTDSPPTPCVFWFSQADECYRFLVFLYSWWECHFRLLIQQFSLNGDLFGLCEVVGTVEGGRVPTKIKTDLKKPVVNLACHPRLPILVSFIMHFVMFHLFICPFKSYICDLRIHGSVSWAEACTYFYLFCFSM